MRFLLLTLLAVVLNVTGCAPCSNCKTPQDRIEKATCCIAQAHIATVNMAQSYRHAMGLLSPQRQAKLRKEQREFLSNTDRECLEASKKSKWKRPYNQCLLEHFINRKAELERKAIEIGSHIYVFDHISRKKKFRFIECGVERDLDYPDEIFYEATVLQLDGDTLMDRPFNRHMEIVRLRDFKRWYGEREITAPYRTTEKSEEDTWNETCDYSTFGTAQSILSASDEVASIMVRLDDYSYGASHGNSNAYFIIWSFKENRELQDAELLVRNKRVELVGLVSRHWKSAGIMGPEPSDTDSQQFISYKAFCGPRVFKIDYKVPTLEDETGHVSLSRATIDRHGVTFWTESRPCFGSSFISWDEMRPYLVQPLPFDPSKLETNKHAEVF